MDETATLSCNEDELVRQVVNNNFIEELSIDWTSSEIIPPKHNDTEILIKVPYTGHAELFKYKPNPSQMWHLKIYVEKGLLNFRLDWKQDPVRLRQKLKEVEEYFLKELEHQSPALRKFNQNLVLFSKGLLQNHKQKILANLSAVEQIGIKLSDREDIPKTFTISPPQICETIEIKETKTLSHLAPEPTLDEESYQKILKVFRDIGKNIERFPSAYTNREETLRDIFLIIISPQFNGTSTGESFNVGGKTDVLLRYKNTNIFIAEFKIWRGPKIVKDSVDQLLSYLT